MATECAPSAAVHEGGRYAAMPEPAWLDAQNGNGRGSKAPCMVAGDDPNPKRPVPKIGGVSQRPAQAAINLLEAFIRQCQAYVAAGILTAAEAQPLIDAAQDLI